MDGKIDYQHARNRTFLEKIGDRIVNGFYKVQNKISEVMDPILESGGNFLGIGDDENDLEGGGQQNTFEEKIDNVGANAGKTGTSKYMPLAIASMAAMAIGGMALFASGSPSKQYMSSARSFNQDVQAGQDKIVERIHRGSEQWENQ
jgi:hypothetical protein